MIQSLIDRIFLRFPIIFDHLSVQWNKRISVLEYIVL